MPLFLDLHAVQSVPVANLNRDDLGSPKSVRYGNANRIRVSSQSWKRVIRHGVEEDLGERARRSRLVPRKVAEALTGEGWPADLADFAGRQVVAAVGKKGLGLDDAGRTNVLLYVPEAAIGELAAVCTEHRAELEKAAASKAKKPPLVLPSEMVEEILNRRTASISLFGRMLAELPDSKVDGAAQVAHALTTHASEPQRDYFTAVDDWLGDSETGSGHLSTAEFSAGVFYRYATINIDDLNNNLAGDTKAAREVVAAFADHFLMSLPQAKRTSSAPHTLPDLAYLAVRERRPVSFAAAFETPVRADQDGGFSGPSRTAMDAYAHDITRLIGTRRLRTHGHSTVSARAGAGQDDPAHLGQRHDSFESLIDTAVNALFDTTDTDSGDSSGSEAARA
ncbi:type I-E CRISPR-associated protein Cas7/Cse4/CasC [Streptomyces phytophilus]|uniref:type I-E CRISPR-associated protein Cas7/Cse4/CasC n=1 Tax=Streptomyces phytophilus TaxID=722715 RepID=UPI0015F00588|nr:type I-E CRISPR-associated protein Cas7/Cse4/CasC [Streptomyces phytophilus]